MLEQREVTGNARIFRVSPSHQPGKKPHTSVNLKFGLHFHFEVGEAHREALEMISIVGCSISLIAVLVTIAVSLIFWRAIKSPRAKVLLSLCIAIALSCIFVISEGFARDNKVPVYCHRRFLLYVSTLDNPRSYAFLRRSLKFHRKPRFCNIMFQRVSTYFHLSHVGILLICTALGIPWCRFCSESRVESEVWWWNKSLT